MPNWRIGANDIRQMPLEVFPYTVHFKVQGDVVRVFAVALPEPRLARRLY